MLKTRLPPVLALGILAACANMNTTSAASGDKLSRKEVADATRRPSADECGARALQSLVGKSRSEIPARPAGTNWRIACTACPVTLDYRPDRLNIFFDEKTQVIQEVKCG